MSENTQPTKSDAPLILGVSGLRGIVGQSLTPEVAVRYAAAFGEWLINRREFGAHTVAIGRDGRQGGEVIYEAAIDGLIRAGCTVIPLGVATTPSIGMAWSTGCDGGIVVTASHNPKEWNGLKCIVMDDFVGEWDEADKVEPFYQEGDITMVQSGRAPSLVEANEIIQLFEAGTSGQLPSTTGGLEEDEIGIVKQHIYYCQHRSGMLQEERLKSGIVETKNLGFQCVLDSVNCSGSSIAIPFLESIGEVVGLHCSDSGIFPHTPEPTRENLSGEGGLCDAVPGLKADIGFAQDPDADRLAIVDETGHYIGEEYTLVLCAMALLEARGNAGPVAGAPGSSGQTPSASLRSAPPPSGTGEDSRPVLVTNLSTSRMIEDVAAHYGATVERTPVGEANVVDRMKQLTEDCRDVLLGGEGNGGVIWPEVVYVRDSLSGMALTLALMARTGKTVSELVRTIDALSPGGKGYTIVKRKVDIPSKAAADPAVEAVSAWAAGVAGARVDRQDGVRVDFDEGDWAGSWVHVRASNTEAIMRLIAEGPVSKGGGEGITGEVLSAVEAAIAGK